jgi:hypothetical protein
LVSSICCDATTLACAVAAIAFSSSLGAAAVNHSSWTPDVWDYGWVAPSYGFGVRTTLVQWLC